jgi:hypothetical protein
MANSNTPLGFVTGVWLNENGSVVAVLVDCVDASNTTCAVGGVVEGVVLIVAV